VNSRYFLSSAGIHFALLGLLLFSPWSRRSHGPVIMLDGFEYMGGGGGPGTKPAAGPKASQMGQVVPQPVQVPVPQKPAPVQKAQVAEETWKVRNAKTQPTPVKAPAKPPQDEAVRGEKTQQETTNIIRRGVAPNTKAGEGGFDFGAPGETSGSGKGVGIGFGEGGSGFGGFGSYFRIVRQRVWSEWTQSAVYGSNESCVVGLTIGRNGDVSDIRVEKPSGNGFYDSVALRAVRNASPLPPLPSSFPNDEQRVRIQFRLME
jgi:protein TonB